MADLSIVRVLSRIVSDGDRTLSKVVSAVCGSISMRRFPMRGRVVDGG